MPTDWRTERLRDGPASGRVVDAAEDQVEPTARVVEDLGVQLPVVGQHRVADLAAEASGEPPGEHLRLEVADLRAVEGLAGHVASLDPIHVHQEEWRQAGQPV